MFGALSTGAGNLCVSKKDLRLLLVLLEDSCVVAARYGQGLR